MNTLSSETTWSFPFCPTPPGYQLDWQGLLHRFHWLQALAGVVQDPVYHAEGDVLLHTHMVVEALVALPEWRALPLLERQQLFAAALFHDVGKPLCTKMEPDGHISSRGHARKGEHIAREELWLGNELPALPFAPREYIARLVRFHGLPLQFLNRQNPQRGLIEASMSVRLDHLALLAEADVRGRTCTDQAELLERVALFRDFAQEQVCYQQPRQFANEQSRFVYFQKEDGDPNYAAYDDTRFEVILLSGLPGSGKDTWLRQHLPHLSVISLDEIRKAMGISPEGEQGQVIHRAREQARTFLRIEQPFVWNATNISKMLRHQLIELFVVYGARVRIMYIDAPFSTILERNRQRQAQVPEAVIYKLLRKLEVPDVTEAQRCEYVSAE